jgi:hypothetical protein
MSLKKNWNNEVIAQFYATLYVEEHGDTRNFHLMTERDWYEVSYAQFARLLGFGSGDANHPKIHMALRLKASKLNFIYLRNKGGSCGTIIDLLPVYAYLNHHFRKTMTPKEGYS